MFLRKLAFLSALALSGSIHAKNLDGLGGLKFHQSIDEATSILESRGTVTAHGNRLEWNIVNNGKSMTVYGFHDGEKIQSFRVFANMHDGTPKLRCESEYAALSANLTERYGQFELGYTENNNDIHYAHRYWSFNNNAHIHLFMNFFNKSLLGSDPSCTNFIDYKPERIPQDVHDKIKKVENFMKANQL